MEVSEQYGHPAARYGALDCLAPPVSALQGVSDGDAEPMAVAFGFKPA